MNPFNISGLHHFAQGAGPTPLMALSLVSIIAAFVITSLLSAVALSKKEAYMPFAATASMICALIFFFVGTREFASSICFALALLAGIDSSLSAMSQFRKTFFYDE